MKVFIENLKPNMSPYNGKGKFAIRLAKSLTENGIKIVETPDFCDINLCFNKIPENNFGKKIVRLDNVTYCNEAMQVKTNANERIRESILKSDGVVYQSKTAKNICETILGVSNPRSAICGNGVDPKDFNPQNIELKGKTNFLIACQFLHPLRRIQEVLDCWSEFSKNKNDVFMYVFFDRNMTSIKFNSFKNVITGKILDQEKLNNYAHSCNAVIMTTYRDSCPNFGAEALACGTPLIINKNNGLCEYLNETCGKIVDIDGSDEIKKESWKVPPFENRNDLIDAFEFYHEKDKQKVIFPEELTIGHVAKSYISFFRSLL